MVDFPERFDPIADRVNLEVMTTRLVVVVGLGSVGSHITSELANVHVGHLRLFDGKPLQERNLARHVLTSEYVDQNKAEAMKRHLSKETPELVVTAIPQNIEPDISDDLLDRYLSNADLVVVATDDHPVQRVMAHGALMSDIPAVIPAMYDRRGGEVFAQRSPRWPCFHCWDEARPADAAVREAAATKSDILGIVKLASDLCLALLDPDSDYAARLFRPSAGETTSPNLFVDNNLGRTMRSVPWRRNCPSCGGNTAEPEVIEPPPAPPDSTGGDVPSTPLAPSQRVQRDRTGTLALVVLAAIGLFFAVEAAIPRHPPRAEISGPTTIKVDYHQSLAQMIAATHLLPNMNYVPITEKRFPVTSGPAEVDVVSVSLTDTKPNESEATSTFEPTSEAAKNRAEYVEVQHELDRLGYRPATMPELLAYIAQASSPAGPPEGLTLVGPVYRGEYVICGGGDDLRCTTVAEGFDRTFGLLAVKK